MRTVHCDEGDSPNREIENHILAPGCRKVGCTKGACPEPTKLDHEPLETPLFPIKVFDKHGSLLKIVYYE